MKSADYTPEGIEVCSAILKSGLRGSQLSKNDRIWCIIDAQKLTVVTAREVPKV